jgi:hypothetical protein
MLRRRAVQVWLTLAAPAWVLGSAAAATAPAVVVGQTAPSPAVVVDCAGKAIVVQDADAGSPSYSTAAGVITSWSVVGSPITGSDPITLKIVRRTSPGKYTVTGSSQLRSLVAAVNNSFADRIPVTGGDRLALFMTGPGATSCAFSTGSSGDVLTEYVGSSVTDLPVGGSFSTVPAGGSVRLDLSATIEPDADGDGYGDLTQDACPTRSDRTTECVPPDTTLSAPRVVRTSATRVKVKALFVATEPATFTCSIDGGRAKPCTSPFKLRLRLGKHHLAVTATDAAGNLDPTPAIVTIKVKKRP